MRLFSKPIVHELPLLVFTLTFMCFRYSAHLGGPEVPSWVPPQRRQVGLHSLQTWSNWLFKLQNAEVYSKVETTKKIK